MQLRTAVCEVLQREDELIEAVQTKGRDTMTEDDKVVLETAKCGPRACEQVHNKQCVFTSCLSTILV